MRPIRPAFAASALAFSLWGVGAIVLPSLVVGCKSTPPSSTTPASAAASGAAKAGAKPTFFGDDAGTDEMVAFDPDGGLDLGASAGPPKPVLKAPGAEPRSPLAYDFAMGKPQTVVATLHTSVKEEGGPNGASGGDMPPLRFTMTVVASEKVSERTRFNAHVVKAEVVPPAKGALPKEVLAQVAELSKVLGGLGATFLVSKQGEVGDLAFQGDQKTQQVASDLLPVLQQAFDLFFAPTPADAVGLGAQWEMKSPSPPGAPKGALVVTYSLKERTPAGATIQVDTQRASPVQPIQDPRAPKGATLEMAGKGSFTVNVRLAGVAAKAQGDEQTVITMNDPSATPPRVVKTTVKREQSIEVK